VSQCAGILTVKSILPGGCGHCLCTSRTAPPHEAGNPGDDKADLAASISAKTEVRSPLSLPDLTERSAQADTSINAKPLAYLRAAQRRDDSLAVQ
jgi:hypothetical protein